MARQASKAQQIIERVRNFFDAQVGELSQREYLDVIEGTISILEVYKDCVKDELADEVDR